MRASPRQEVPLAFERLTGSQKAAILLLAIGESAASSVMKQMSPAEIDSVALEMARLPSVSNDVVEQVLREFYESRFAGQSVAGGIHSARAVLTLAFGADAGQEILARVQESIPEESFRALRELDAAQIVSLLGEEHPQTIALILVHLDPRKAALVLAAIPFEMRADIVRRMAGIGSLIPGTIRKIEQKLEEHVSTLHRPIASAGGPQAVIDILHESDPTAGNQLLDAIAEEDPELAETLRNLLFVFEDLVQLDNRVIRELLKEVDTKHLSLALKGTSEELRAKIFANMSRRAKDVILEDMGFLGPVRIAEVIEARRGIVMILRNLAEGGVVALTAEKDTYVT